MICAFCERDVRRPCQTEQDLQRRAMSHVEPCERALKIQRGLNPPRSADARTGE